MYDTKRKVLSQNFLYSRKLVNQLVHNSSIGEKDTVLEIGPGKGIITEVLLEISQKVIAVEFDAEWVHYLQLKFNNFGNKFLLIHKDFLKYDLPTIPYKVFANIPFSIEGEIIRKLVNTHNPPDDCYLVVRKDLAERLMGTDREVQFSATYKPWFSFKIVHQFRMFDYEPAARMETVLFHFNKKETPLLPEQDKTGYKKLIEIGFTGGKGLKYNLRNVFTHVQFKRLAKDNLFSVEAKPSDLSVQQWVKLYEFSKHK